MKRIVTDVARIAPWVIERTGRRKYIPGTCTAIGLERNGDLIAGTLYEDFNGANLMMHVAAERGRMWAGHAYLHECFAYPFEQLECRRVTAVVASNNSASLDLCSHLGFVHDAVLHDAHPEGDLIVLVMWRDKCKWIGGTHEFRQIGYAAAA